MSLGHSTPAGVRPPPAAPRAPFWKVDPHLPEGQAVAQAVSVILRNGVIVYPTETFYGLGGLPRSEPVERIYAIKGRDFKKPLPLIAADRKAVRRAVTEWPTAAERLAQAFWPGPLTMILPAAPWLPSALLGQTGKIALRVSSHPVARTLAERVGGLLIATSANAAGEPAYTNAMDISAPFAARVDGVLDAGPLPGQLPSTIVDLSVEPPRLVRPGCIFWTQIEPYLHAE